MIKPKTVGMFDVAKNDPTMTKATPVDNYSFVTGRNGNVALVYNTPQGHASYEEYTIPAGQPLNCYDITAWDGMEFVIDIDEIDGYASAIENDTSVKGLKIVANAASGKDVVAVTASGAITTPVFKITDPDTTLTGKAVTAQLVYAGATF